MVHQGTIPNRVCEGSAESAAELAAGLFYDSKHSEPPCEEMVVDVEFCGARKSYRVLPRVHFVAEEIPQPESEDDHG